MTHPTYTTTAYYTLEPHTQWADEENGYIPINAIAERVYGRPYNSLLGSAMDRENPLANDQVAIYKLENEDDYEQALYDFRDDELYLGFNPFTRKGLVKSGMTALDYWFSMSVDPNTTNPEIQYQGCEGVDHEGVVFKDQTSADRAYTPSLQGILADLIDKGELPRGNYIFRHWW